MRVGASAIYLFGTQATLEEVVAYYRTALKQRGDIVFERPATYMFEVGRLPPGDRWRSRQALP